MLQMEDKIYLLQMWETGISEKRFPKHSTCVDAETCVLTNWRINIVKQYKISTFQKDKGKFWRSTDSCKKPISSTVASVSVLRCDVVSSS